MWQEDKSFIEICDENLLIASKFKHENKPVKLVSYPNFKEYENTWWSEFHNNSSRVKFRLKNEHESIPNIPIIQSLSNNLFSKIFKKYKITCWVSLDKNDVGTDWHRDTQGNEPRYAIIMNLVGNTTWQIENHNNVNMIPGSIFLFNAGIPHKVETSDKRITLACHGFFDDIIL